MGHSFKPVTTGEEIQVAILDELQKISSLLEPSEPAVDMEPASEPTVAVDAPATGEPAPKAVSKKPPVKATARKRVTGQ